MNRKFRANNPEGYKKDYFVKKDKYKKRKKGVSIKGVRLRNRSKALKQTIEQVYDMFRRQAAHRKSLHGKLVNKILRVGSHIKTEKLSYKGWQKLFGSSIGLRAPGKFVENLRRKAENAGGRVEEVNTYKTKLSQVCHCGQHQKKLLSERWHICSCGVKAQRDLCSAYLVNFVEKDKLIGPSPKGLGRDGYRPTHGYE